MIFNFKYVERNYNSTYPESIVTLEDQPIENVKQFRYLGDEVRFDEPSTGDAESDLRISICLLYTSPSPRDQRGSRMPSSA